MSGDYQYIERHFHMMFEDREGWHIIPEAVPRETRPKSRYRNPRVKHPCSGCGEERDTTGRYCRLCRSAYMRQWRQAHPHSGTRRRDDPEA